MIAVTREQLNQLKQPKVKPTPHIKDQLIINQDTHFASKNAAEIYKGGKRDEQRNLEELMISPTTKWEDKKIAPLKLQADAYKNGVWHTLPANAKRILGTISYTEAVQLANIIYHIQVNSPSPDVVIPFEQIAYTMAQLRKRQAGK